MNQLGPSRRQQPAFPVRTRDGRMILTLFLHARDWVDVPLADGRRTPVVDHSRLARKAEAAGLHALFIADTFGIDLEAESASINSGVEPVTTMAYLAALTQHIGLVATVSSTFTEPFNLIRQLGSLDSLSRGRAGWNVVTSGWGEQYFGKAPLPSHAERYRRASEFVDLAKAVWSSWGEGALNISAGGASIRPGHIHRIAHDGEFFSLHGAADKPPSPQGHPLIVQAGSSPDGIDFAVKHAELVFTSQPFDDDAGLFYCQVKAQSRRPFGARGQWPLVLPGVTLVLSENERELAERQAESLAAITHEQALRVLRNPLAGVDLSDLELDDRIPAERLPPPETVQSRQTFYHIYRRRALEQGFTIRQLVQFSNYHWQINDTPEGAAQRLIDRFERGLADGFNIMPTDEASYALIFDRLVPLLWESDFAAREHASSILRENILATAYSP